jgi:transposase
LRGFQPASRKTEPVAVVAGTLDSAIGGVGVCRHRRRGGGTGHRDLIVFEATGGYECAAVAALAAAQLLVVVANPYQVRGFARATGQLGRIDADFLALFAEGVRPASRTLPGDAAKALHALLTRRRQVLEMLMARRN